MRACHCQGLEHQKLKQFFGSLQSLTTWGWCNHAKNLSKMWAFFWCRSAHQNASFGQWILTLTSDLHLFWRANSLRRPTASIWHLYPFSVANCGPCCSKWPPSSGWWFRMGPDVTGRRAAAHLPLKCGWPIARIKFTHVNANDPMICLDDLTQKRLGPSALWLGTCWVAFSCFWRFSVQAFKHCKVGSGLSNKRSQQRVEPWKFPPKPWGSRFGATGDRVHFGGAVAAGSCVGARAWGHQQRLPPAAKRPTASTVDDLG